MFPTNILKSCHNVAPIGLLVLGGGAAEILTDCASINTTVPYLPEDFYSLYYVGGFEYIT